MSSLSILPYFPFQRIRITQHPVFPDSEISQLTAVPDERFRPICHVCGSKAQRIYRHDKRSLRDLNLGSVRVWIKCSYRKIACEPCNRIVVEDLGFFQPYSRVTHRLAAYIHELCKVLTVTEVAKHFGINWKTVKAIDTYFLEQQYAQTDYQNLRILAVDEISVKKGQRYFGLCVLIQEAAEREMIHRVIYDELVLGEIKAESKAQYLATIDRLIDCGAQGIILGCTEIGLLIQAADCRVPVFDTTRLHVAGRSRMGPFYLNPVDPIRIIRPAHHYIPSCPQAALAG